MVFARNVKAINHNIIYTQLLKCILKRYKGYFFVIIQKKYMRNRYFKAQKHQMNS